MIAILAALAVTAAPIQVRQTCALTRLSACENTNELFYDKAFKPAVKRFIGRGRARYLYHGTIVDQQLDALGGSPDAPERIENLYRFTACRDQSCPEKGAVVMRPDGRLVATAILHTNCMLPKSSEDCFAHDTLTMFVHGGADSKAVVRNLSEWAKTMVGEEYNAPGMPVEQLDAVEIYSVADGVRTLISRRSLGL